MKLHPDIGMMKFDRIVYNFPHAGFKGKEDDLGLIRKHRNLVYGFLLSARRMLRPDGEIHVNHKTTAPFSSWNLQQLASCNSLISLTPVEFKIEDFPGYSNKRGDGSRPDEKFPLGSCSTFIFVLPPYKIHKPCNLHPASDPTPFPRQNHSLMNDHYESNSIRDSFGIAMPPLFHSPSPPRHSFGIYGPPLSHSPEIVRPPPRCFDFVPYERETNSVMSPSPRLGFSMLPLFHSPPGIVRHPLSHPPRINWPPPRSPRIDWPSHHSFSSMNPTPRSPGPGMFSSMLEDNTNIPRHFNMLREHCSSFDGYRIHVNEAVRLDFERHPYAADEEDPRRSSRGYPH